ncbi:MAG: glycosyltransferase [Anaerolineae bacterium]|nr:glycosyltransferase [Anaerolineae bacterium]
MKLQSFTTKIIQVLSLLASIYMLYYLWWRFTHTLNPGALGFSMILLGAEAFGVFSYLLFAWMTKDISSPFQHKKPKSNISVDIFVPTYNEGIEIIEATLVGCNMIDYPHKTHVLDDGKREEVRQLTEKMGCHYITRDTNEHAKAGNINHALTQTDGEFIVVLDCDMVPQPHFLDRTLGYFENENLAIIQTPQEFYNEDSIQHDNKGPSWHEQSLFFRVIQPGKNWSESAFWTGSPSIVRRSAILEIGGIATETVTEDIHTSVRLHARGKSILFLNEVLAYGIAPQTIKAFLLQRLRWAQGTMQLYRSKESPLIIPGLSFSQRLSYLASFLAYFESFQRIILILSPIFILLFDVFPMKVSGFQFFLHWIPFISLTLFTNRISGRGYFKYFQTEKFNTLKMVVFLQSSIMLFWSKPLKFMVTPKTVDSTVYKDEKKELRIYIYLLVFIASVITIGLIKLISNANSAPENYFSFVAIFWAAYNGFLIYAGMKEVFSKRHDRKEYRFPVKLNAEVIESESNEVQTDIQITDLSRFGAGLIINPSIKNNLADTVLHFHTPDDTCIFLPIDKVYPQGYRLSGKQRVGISFGKPSSIYRTRLLQFLFVSLPGLNSQPSAPAINAWPNTKASDLVFSPRKLNQGILENPPLEKRILRSQ